MSRRRRSSADIYDDDNKRTRYESVSEPWRDIYLTGIVLNVDGAELTRRLVKEEIFPKKIDWLEPKKSRSRRKQARVTFDTNCDAKRCLRRWDGQYFNWNSLSNKIRASKFREDCDYRTV